MTGRILTLVAAAALAAAAQKYDGPKPTKPDLPYLKHGDSLVATEAAAAKEEHKKDDVLYTVAGASSTVKTPLSAPVFVFLSDKLVPDRLQLYRLEAKGGQREILFAHKSPPKAYRLEVTRLSPDNIYKLEVNDDLEPGEYVLSPEGSNQVFCFQVY